MSVREKSAWICLVAIIAVYIPYFAYVYRLLQHGKFQTDTVFAAFINAAVIQAVLVVAGAILFVCRQGKEPKDERDVAIEARSFRNAYGVLIACAFLLITGIPLYSLSGLAAKVDHGLLSLLAVQALLLSSILAETIKFLTLAVGYRRGF